MWNPDRFNARRGNSLGDTQRSLTVGTHSTAAATTLLSQINNEKVQAGAIISTAIDGSWIGYANAMGLTFQEPQTYETRQIVTMQDLRVALHRLSEEDRLAALYFITGYTRDVLYSQVIWGTTHQAAVKDYVLLSLNARFATSRTDMTAGHKSCVGLLYAQIYNRKKQTLQKTVSPANIQVSIGMNGRSIPRSCKRPKELYFVHTAEDTKDNTTMHLSKKVIPSCPSLCHDRLY